MHIPHHALQQFGFLASLAFAFCLSSPTHATNSINPLIVGGKNTETGDWPWVAALVGRNQSAISQFCGGTLIDRRWVLTAAHCVDDVTSNGIDVVININDLNNEQGEPNSERLAVVSVITHPQFDRNSLENDLALLLLEQAATTPPIQRISALTIASLPEGTPLTTIGWGDTDASDSTNFPSILQQTELPFVSNRTCATGGPVTNNMLCAGAGNGASAVCNGDSGGPLMYHDGNQWLHTGITSYGQGQACAADGAYDVFTNTERYQQWIDQNIGALQLHGQFNYGPVGAGKTTSLQRLLENTSQQALTINGLSPSRAELTVISDSCTGTTLAAGEQCSIIMQLTGPQQSGNYEEQLQIDYQQAQVAQSSHALVNFQLMGYASQQLHEALDHPALEWFTSAGANWSAVRTSDSHNGTAAQSAAIGDAQDTTLMSYVQGPATVRFRWNVSSEADFDFHQLLVNNVFQSQISGERPFRNSAIRLSSGCHQLLWRYRKDLNQTQNRDLAQLDQVSIDGTPIAEGPCLANENARNNLPQEVVTGNAGGGGSGGGGAAHYLLLLLALLLALRPKATYALAARWRPE